MIAQNDKREGAASDTLSRLFDGPGPESGTDRKDFQVLFDTYGKTRFGFAACKYVAAVDTHTYLILLTYGESDPDTGTDEQTANIVLRNADRIAAVFANEERSHLSTRSGIHTEETLRLQRRAAVGSESAAGSRVQVETVAAESFLHIPRILFGIPDRKSVV